MSRPATTVEANLDHLASAVFFADGYGGKQTVKQIAHILEIALKNRLGLIALGGNTVHVDLGNGHLLVCTTKVKPRAKAGAEL